MALPAIVGNKHRINVWHAGCSTGEEVFTINIVAREIGLEGKIHSLASDMNTDALQHASEGKYHLLKLQEYDHNYKKYTNDGSLTKYYSQDGKEGTMDLTLIKNVKFEEGNLITDVNRNKYDIIFCRNVMIYFDSGAKKLVLDKFYNCLNPGGLLIIGFFDALVPIIDKERFEFFDLNQKIFRRINKTLK